jgi:hypothetical protein
MIGVNPLLPFSRKSWRQTGVKEKTTYKMNCKWLIIKWTLLGSNRADRLETVRWTVLGRSQHAGLARYEMVLWNFLGLG